MAQQNQPLADLHLFTDTIYAFSISLFQVMSRLFTDVTAARKMALSFQTSTLWGIQLWGLDATRPISNAFILISSLFFALPLKEIYGSSRPRFAFARYRISAHIHKWPLSVPPPLPSLLYFQPLLHLQLISTLESYFSRKAAASLTMRASEDRKPVIWLSDRNTARLNTIAKRIINTFLLESKGHGAMKGKKRTSPQRMRLDFS